MPPVPLLVPPSSFRAQLLPPYLRTLKILHKQSISVVPFPLSAPQLRFLDAFEWQMKQRQRVRMIVLKARQMGFSTAIGGTAFTLAKIIPNYRVEIMAHENDASANLLKMSARFWENYWGKPLFTPKHLATNRMEWKESGSQFHISTAGGKGGGRSSTIHFLHASEVAFWPDAQETYKGIAQTVPEADTTVILQESTANGIGNFFHGQWNAACEGEIDYYPFFCAWFEDPAYRASVAKLDVPLTRLTDEEKVLRNMGIDDDQLKWRRWTIANKCNRDVLTFCQEYPATPEEAFLSTGTNVFPLAELQKIYKPVDPYVGKLIETPKGLRFVQDSSGPLKILAIPEELDIESGYWLGRPRQKYLIGADTVRSAQNDYAVAQVINRRTLEQVAVLRERLLPVEQGKELLKLGKFFGEAIIAPEKEFEGHLVIGMLLGAAYPFVWMHEKIDSVKGKPNADNFGWSTNVQTKPQLVGMMQDFVNAGYSSITGTGLIIHDQTTFKEMSQYVRKDNGEYGPADEESGGHDDTVMALGIALFCNYLEPLDMSAPSGWEMPRYSKIMNALSVSGGRGDGELDPEILEMLSGEDVNSGLSN